MALLHRVLYGESNHNSAYALHIWVVELKPLSNGVGLFLCIGSCCVIDFGPQPRTADVMGNVVQSATATEGAAKQLSSWYLVPVVQLCCYIHVFYTFMYYTV